VRLFARRGFDWTERFPWIARAARRLPVSRFLIEGWAGQDLVVLLSC
jgi:ATP-dependent DNA ligase